MAVAIASNPSIFWTSDLDQTNHFTGYYAAMGMWFRLVGPDLPSWLFWHAVAGGVLVWVAYLLGRELGGPWCGLVAGMWVVADRITLHLMATLNMETFFLPLLYLAVLLWHRAASRPAWWAALAGGVLGLATIVRPTVAALPLVWLGLLPFERTRFPTHPRWRQAAAMLGGFSVGLVALLLHHRIAWESWTLGGVKATTTSLKYHALLVHGQHPADVGVGPWLQLVFSDPHVIWTRILPGWWDQLFVLWTHPGFGQMDLVQGLSHAGPYQAALTTIIAACAIWGAWTALRSRSRLALQLVVMPVYFSSFVVAFFMLNARYRASFIPALILLACLGVTAAKRAVSGARPVHAGA
jgi:hypothetical protein